MKYVDEFRDPVAARLQPPGGCRPDPFRPTSHHRDMPGDTLHQGPSRQSQVRSRAYRRGRAQRPKGRHSANTMATIQTGVVPA